MHTTSPSAAGSSQPWTVNGCIGRTVGAMCLEHRVTQQQIGEALGIAGATVSRKIRGLVAWSATDLYIVADLFHIAVTDLLPIQNPDWKKGDDEQFRWLPAPVKPPVT